MPRKTVLIEAKVYCHLDSILDESLRSVKGRYDVLCSRLMASDKAKFGFDSESSFSTDSEAGHKNVAKAQLVVGAFEVVCPLVCGFDITGFRLASSICITTETCKVLSPGIVFKNSWLRLTICKSLSLPELCTKVIEDSLIAELVLTMCRKASACGF